MTACYTVEEVKVHNKSSDCWVIYKGKVYDVTPFLEDHPGGQEIVLEHAGADCTNAFEDVGHSSSAYDMLKDFFIGDCVEKKEKSETTAVPASCAPTSSCCASKSKPCSASNQSNLPLIGAVVIIGAAIVYNSFFRK